MADGKPPATATELAPQTSETSGPSELYGWYVLLVVLIASVFSYIDRNILALLVIPIKRDLMLSDTQMSLLIGFAFAIFHVTMGLPIGWLVDRTKRINVIAIGVLFWSVMTALQGIARNFTALFIFRMGVGVGEAALQPAVYSMMPDYFRAHRLGIVMGIYGTSISIGSGIAYILGAQVIEWLQDMNDLTMPGIGIIYSWQLVFLAVGLPGLLISFWCWTLREAPRRGALRMEVTASGETKLGTVKFREVVDYILKNARSYFGINFCYALVAVCGYGSNAWIPTYLQRSHGFTAVEAGHWLGLLVIPSGTLGILTGGVVCDWIVRRGRENGRIYVMTAGGLIAAPFALAFPLVSDPYLSLALMCPTFFFMAFVTAGWMASMPQMMPNQMRGLSLAIAVVINNLMGLGLGPLLIALMTDHVFHNEMMLNYSIAIVCCSALLLATLSCITSIGAFSRSLRYLEKWQDDATPDPKAGSAT